LGVATVILIALLGLTVWRLNARKGEDQPSKKVEVKLPKIESDKIDELDIAAADRPRVHLVKKGSEWRLTEPVDAEADADAVSSALTKLTELEVTGVAATLAKNYEKLEVEPKKGTRVIAKAGGKPVLDAWIGSYQAGNSMIRIEGQVPVATVRGSIRYAFSKHVREWRDREITEVPTADVQKIVFHNPKGHYEFVRDGDSFKQLLAKGEKPIQPLDTSKVKGIVGTASSLDATDFAEPGVTAEQAGLGPSAATVTLMLDGDAGAREVVYRVGGQKDQSYYVQRDGVATIYLVSQWIGGRLTSGVDDLTKKDTPPADPHAGMPQGMPGMPPGMQMPPGMPGNVIQMPPPQQ
ncbi:MAG TPA: DUF4340 domain-containing protein, partial [Polyangiales bacterium]|nr:DUF4340 domain-containing protein [Polyangiales bacterium]